MNTTTQTKLPEKGLDSKPESFLRIVICVCMLLIMGFLTMVSMLQTTHVADDETISYLNDNFILNLIWLGLCTAICFAVLPLLKKAPFWAELVFISLWTILFGLIWVFSSQSAVAYDSGSVNNAAMQAAENDLSFMEDYYFKTYSFQLGYVFFYEMIIRAYSLFATVKNLLFLQVINIVFLTGSYIAILLINQKIFRNPQVRRLTVLILAFAVQPIIFSSFLYGIIPGLMFALYAVYFELIYLENNKLQYGLISAVLIAVAILLKLNYMIVMVAMLLLALAKLLRRKHFLRDALYILVTVVLAVSVNPAVKSIYEHRSNQELGESMPFTCWVSMGMNEAWNAPGWYNPTYSVTTFENTGYDAAESGKLAIENIQDRLKTFSDDSQYCQDFYSKKAISQWNETSYESICLNKAMGNYKERGRIATWVMNEGEQTVKRYMDYYAQFIFVAVFVGLIACLRRKKLEQTILPLIILGGFLYHLMSEAKSQYSTPYFICMLGFAPYGISCICDFLREKTAPLKAKLSLRKILKTDAVWGNSRNQESDISEQA